MKFLILILMFFSSSAFSQGADFLRDYETVAASQTDQRLGVNGAQGDIIEKLIITVGTSATGTVSIQDGSGSDIPITAANTPIGVYTVFLGMRATTDWRVTTGAGATVIAVGRFR